MSLIKKTLFFIAVALIAVITIFFLVNSSMDKIDNDKVLTVDDYEQEKVVAAIQSYLFSDLGIDYSSSEIERRILASQISKIGFQYCLLQLPYNPEGEIVPGVDVVRVVQVIKEDEEKYLSVAYTPGYVLGSDDPAIQNPPYVQVVLPVVEEYLYFTATKVFDDRYGVYLGDEKLQLNASCIVAACVLSETPISNDDMLRVVKG